MEIESYAYTGLRGQTAVNTYQELLKKDAFDLGDAEFNALRHRIHDILLDTREVQL